MRMLDALLRMPMLSRDVPPSFKRLYPIKMPCGAIELLRQQGLQIDSLYLQAYNVLLWGLLTLAPLAVILMVMLPYPLKLLSASAVLVAVVAPVAVLATPTRRYRSEQRSYLLDSPAVVGAMSMSMNRSSSLERALELGCRSGDGALQSSLSRLVWKAITGEVQDLRNGISAWTANLDARNEGLSRALHLIMAAEEESGKEGRDRLLDRANSLVLEGMREACEGYVGSLSFPVMLVFAFGVLAPVMLFSLIPLMGLGTSLPSDHSALNVTSLAVVLLALVPVVTLLYVRYMIARNPLGRTVKRKAKVDKGQWAVLILSIPASAMGIMLTGQVVPFTLLGLALVLVALYLTGGRPAKQGDERVASFVDGLYRLGNGMLGGQDLEASFEDAVVVEDGGFQRWGLRVLHVTRTGRTSLSEAVKEDLELRTWNPALHQNYMTVMECAREDHRGAGKVAINLAQCLNDLARTKRRIRESLRSVVDMMTSTSLLFAPAIIGLTSGIMGMLGEEEDWLTAVASVYVVELALLVNYFTSNLDGWQGCSEGWRAYAVRGSVALSVFLTASLCGQMFLFHLL